ncbi:hypothetical protein LguiB_009996 [Lonicera macranthoides]
MEMTFQGVSNAEESHEKLLNRDGAREISIKKVFNNLKNCLGTEEEEPRIGIEDQRSAERDRPNLDKPTKKGESEGSKKFWAWDNCFSLNLRKGKWALQDYTETIIKSKKGSPMLQYDEQEVESDDEIYDTDDARKVPLIESSDEVNEKNNQAKRIVQILQDEIEFGNADELWTIENGSRDPREEAIYNVDSREEEMTEDEYSSNDDRANKYVFEKDVESETWLKKLFYEEDRLSWRSREQVQLVHKGLPDFTQEVDITIFPFIKGAKLYLESWAFLLIGLEPINGCSRLDYRVGTRSTDTRQDEVVALLMR